MAGIIAPAYSYFAEYRFKFVLDKADILARFNPARRQFLEQVFANAPQARSWCTMDFEALWQGYQGSGRGPLPRWITCSSKAGLSWRASR